MFIYVSDYRFSFVHILACLSVCPFESPTIAGIIRKGSRFQSVFISGKMPIEMNNKQTDRQRDT